jgi:hypothetical protein
LSHSAWHRVAVGVDVGPQTSTLSSMSWQFETACHYSRLLPLGGCLASVKTQRRHSNLKCSGSLRSLHAAGQTARFLPVGAAGDDRRARTCANPIRNRAGGNCPAAATRTPRCRIPTRRWRRSQGIDPCHAFRPTSTTPQTDPLQCTSYIVLGERSLAQPASASAGRTQLPRGCVVLS